jgi:hypothetical protein
MENRRLYTCRFGGDIVKLIGLLNNEDHTAVTPMLLGPCKLLSNPGPLYVEDLAVPCAQPREEIGCIYIACVRPQGQGQLACEWSNRDWLTKDKPGPTADRIRELLRQFLNFRSFIPDGGTGWHRLSIRFHFCQMSNYLLHQLPTL